MRYPYGEILQNESVIRLAAEAAALLEIRIPSKDTLLMMISKPKPMPVIYRRADAALWVDRYYIAFIHDDAPGVEYLYLTRQHIIEERITSLRQQRQRGYSDRIPDPIQWQFAAAWREMNRTGEGYALRPVSWQQGAATAHLDVKASSTPAIPITPALPAAGPW